MHLIQTFLIAATIHIFIVIFLLIIMPLCRSFEMALAACASPLVGFLAERVFGFKGAAAAGAGGGTEPLPDQREDLDKAKALGNALLVCLVVPWTICLIVYTGQAAVLSYCKCKGQSYREQK